MKKYNEQELIKRNKIIKSQIYFGNFLDYDLINKLINLFDSNNKSEESIVKYIENERKLRNYDTKNVIIKSEVYGTNKMNSTLFLKIIKNGDEFLHLSIHLISTTINSNKTGIIHFKKNIYTKKISRKERYKLYSLISVNKPLNKIHSLEFSIADGFNTPSNIKNIQYDNELQKEMSVIITVLNRLFNEKNTELYIGNSNKLYPIHNNINNILNNINSHSIYTKRKNKGIKLFSITNRNKTPIKIKYNKNKRLTRRKLHKLLN